MSDQLKVEIVFDALGEPVRRAILRTLKNGPMPVGRIAEQVSAGRPGVSKHLRVLSEAGLVRHESRGTRNLYALAPDGLAPAQHWLVGLWDVALTSYADAVSAATADATHRERTSP